MSWPTNTRLATSMALLELSEELAATGESADRDFKEGCDPKSSGEMLELIKDLIAMANSGGGTILIGVKDDGSASGSDVSSMIALDPADLTNKIHKYTGVQFHLFEIVACRKATQPVCAIRVQGARVPVVFAKVGTYELALGKQKAAFSAGTVYFRHGAKSEPAISDDLRTFLEREVEATRRSWLDGIAKVVEAPTGSRVAILPPEGQPTGPSGSIPVRITNDPAAQAYYAVPIDTTHPYRQKEVVTELNKRLDGVKVVNSHHIICIRRVHNIQKDVTFCYTQNYASPRYSVAFVDWIVSQFSSNPSFFEDMKAQFDRLKLGDV